MTKDRKKSINFMQEKIVKNKANSLEQTHTTRSFAWCLVLFVLLFPGMVFGKNYSIQNYSVSSVDVWSNGVILKSGVESDDSSNTYYWFEFSADEHLGSFNATPRRVYSGKQLFSEKIINLSPSTVYYYRTVIEMKNNKYYGDIQGFKTKESGYAEPVGAGTVIGYSYNGGNSYSTYQNTATGNSSNTGYSSAVSSVFSKQASNITDTSALMNSNIIPAADYSVYGWFEWGITPDLEKTTTRVFIGRGKNLYFGQSLSGLTPGTLYFFRPVIENVDGTKTAGVIFAFQTTGVSPNKTITPASGGTSVSGGISATQNAVSSKNQTKTTTPVQQKTIVIKNDSGDTTTAPGDIITRTILFENTTGKELSNVSVRVILPEGETFIVEKDSDCTQNGQVLTCEIGKMSPGQKTNITYTTEISKGVKDKTTLETIIFVTGKDKDGKKVENLQSSESTVNVYKNNTAAAALSGNIKYIFPTTLKDWFSIISFILLLIASYFVWKYFTEKNKEIEVDDKSNPLAGLSMSETEIGTIPQKPHMENAAFVSMPVNEKGAPPPNLPI